MEDSKKKPIMIGVVVACLVLAGLITYTSRSGKTGLEAMKSGEMIWVKCSNPDCGAEYQVDKKDYLEHLQKRQPLTCKECGQDSLSRAVKCEKCGLVFFMGASGFDDFQDRCPECGYSKIEEDRERAQEARKSK